MAATNVLKDEGRRRPLSNTTESDRVAARDFENCHAMLMRAHTLF